MDFRGLLLKGKRDEGDIGQGRRREDKEFKGREGRKRKERERG